MPKMSKVKLYSLSTCPWCAKTKEFFKTNKIPFTNIDVGASQKAAHELIKKTGQTGIPVIMIGKEIVISYNENRLKELLGIK